MNNRIRWKHYLPYQTRREIYRDYLQRALAAQKGRQGLSKAVRLVIFVIAAADLSNPIRVAAQDLGAAIKASGHDAATCHCEMIGTILATDPNPQYVLFADSDLKDRIERITGRKL